jgi:pilus assembly protein CpaB
MKEIDEMKSRAVLVAAAVALALIGTFAVFAYVHNADKRAVAGTKASQVLIAHKEVPAGTSWSDAVKDGYLVAEKIPASAAPESALSSVEAGVPNDDVASASIASGQIVLREMFGTAASANTGAIAIPKGMIAISVAMSSNADVAGFVQPGSEVAIFGTFTVTSPDGKPATSVTGTAQYLTDLILPKVLVTATSVAAPTNVDGKTGSQGTVSAGGSVLVTLAVTQAQAQQVILAQQTGQIYFALLSDSSVTASDGGATNVIASFSPAPLLAK